MVIIYWFICEKTMASNLLRYGDYNVITVHWGYGASGTYVTSACNTRLVGLEIALLVNTLVSHRVEVHSQLKNS